MDMQTGFPDMQTAPARPRPIQHTLRATARLLGYPDAQLRAQLHDLRQAFWDDAALSSERLRGIKTLIEHLAGGDPLEREAEYVELFDRGRATSLHLFEHVHGDSRDRGQAMIDLQQTYADAGLALAPGELPDYLPAVLEFASTQPAETARLFLGEISHILAGLHAALVKRDSAYAELIAAVLEIAGEPLALELSAREVSTRAEAPAEAEPPLDEEWAEPEAFAGCSRGGQNAPEQPQPIHIVRRASAPVTGAAPAAPHAPSSNGAPR